MVVILITKGFPFCGRVRATVAPSSGASALDILSGFAFVGLCPSFVALFGCIAVILIPSVSSLVYLFPVCILIPFVTLYLASIIAIRPRLVGRFLLFWIV